MHILDKKQLRHFLKDAKKARVAIVGDIMLDYFTYGESTRTSPEAPVPVVDVRSRTSIPGGAANVARNVTSLGATVDLYSVLGTDDHALHLVSALREYGISARTIVRMKRPTTVKERIVVNGRHIARMDRETRDPIDRHTQRTLAQHFAQRVQHIDVLVFSDYAKGVITEGLVRDFCRIASRAGVPVIVDTKPVNANHFAGKEIMLLTPNSKEALEISRKKNHESAATYLVDHFATSVLITKGAGGMTLHEKDARIHAEAHAVEAVDVSGCGDTVAATIAIALATKRSKLDSLHFANHAAGIAVQKPGTAIVTPHEFLTFYDA